MIERKEREEFFREHWRDMADNLKDEEKYKSPISNMERLKGVQEFLQKRDGIKQS